MATGNLAFEAPPASADREVPASGFPVSSAQGGLPRKGVARAESPHGPQQDREFLPATQRPSGPRASNSRPDVASIRQKLQELATADLAKMDYETAAQLLGISTRQVSVYTAPTSDKNFPLALVPQWFAVFGKCAPLEWVVARCGLHVVTDATLRDAELGRRVREAGSVLRGIISEVVEAA